MKMTGGVRRGLVRSGILAAGFAVVIGGLGIATIIWRAFRSYPTISVSQLGTVRLPYACVTGTLDRVSRDSDANWSYDLVDPETGVRVKAYDSDLLAGLRRPERHFPTTACGPLQNFPVAASIPGQWLVGPVEYWRGPQSFHPVEWWQGRRQARHERAEAEARRVAYERCEEDRKRKGIASTVEKVEVRGVGTNDNNPLAQDTAPQPEPVVVEIPGVGRREFPAGMSLAQIQTNVNILMREATQKSPCDDIYDKPSGLPH